MTNTEILERIHEFLVEEFEVDAEKLVPEANLKETLGLDSLDYIDLVVVIESNWHNVCMAWQIQRYSARIPDLCMGFKNIWCFTSLLPVADCGALLFLFFL